jgi:hypothetical protein
MAKFTSWKTLSALAKYRTAKYKQRRVLNETGWIADARLAVGACAGLSLEWCKMHRQKPDWSASKRMDAFKVGSKFEQIAWIADVLNNVGTTYAERLQMTCRAYLGQSRAGVELEVPGMSAHLAANPGYHVVLMVLRRAGGNTNHLCALYQGLTHLTFFDPNSGEYKVPNGERANFFQQLEAQYATYVTGAGQRDPVTIREWMFAAVTVL